jgi:hypothetical protein
MAEGAFNPFNQFANLVLDPSSYLSLKVEKDEIKAIVLKSKENVHNTDLVHMEYFHNTKDVILDTPHSYANKYKYKYTDPKNVDVEHVLHLLKKDDSTYAVIDLDTLKIIHTITVDDMNTTGGGGSAPKKKPPAKKKAPVRRKPPAKKKLIEEPKLQAVEESQWSLPLFRFLKFSM